MAVGRRERLNEQEWLQDVWRAIIHPPAGIMLDPAVRVGVRQLGRRARPVNKRERAMRSHQGGVSTQTNVCSHLKLAW